MQYPTHNNGVTRKAGDAGCEIIRAAHYPQDPAFMDACDELGLFVIVALPAGSIGTKIRNSDVWHRKTTGK